MKRNFLILLLIIAFTVFGNGQTVNSLAAGAGGQIHYQSSAAVTAFLANGTAGQILSANGTTVAPSWLSQSSLAVGTATNLAGGSGGQVHYQSSAGVTAFLANGTSGQVLTSAGGTSAPTWTTPATAPTILNTFLSSNFTTSSSSLSNTALSVTLTAGKTYSFTCSLFASGTGSGAVFDFNGGSATATTFLAGSNSALITSTGTALSSGFTASSLPSTNFIFINGGIVVNAGGTFIVRAATNGGVNITVYALSNCSAIQLN